jgi:hypothetical protein
MTDEVIKIHHEDQFFDLGPDHDLHKTFADFQMSDSQMKELYNQNSDGVKIAWDGDVFTPRSSDTITVYPFYPHKPPATALQPFEVVVKAYDSMQVVMQRIERAIRIPMAYWHIFTRPDGELIEPGYMPQVYKLFEPNGAAVDMVLRQAHDIKIYKQERNRIRAEITAKNRQLRLQRTWRTANRGQEDTFTQDQFNRYVTGRDNVEEKAEGSIKNKSLKEGTDAIRDEAVATLKKDWEVKLDDDTWTLLREGIYAHELKITSTGIGPARSGVIMVRVYSPVVIGNSIDLFLKHWHQTRYSRVESARYLCYVKNNIFSDQSLKVIKEHSTRTVRRTNNIFLVEYDPKIHREIRFFTSYHKMDKLKEHLFGQDLSQQISTRRFAKYLVRVAGLGLIKKEGDENDDTLGSIRREIDRYYPGEEEEYSDDEEDEESDKSNEGYISGEDVEVSSDEDDQETRSAGTSGYCNQQ